MALTARVEDYLESILEIEMTGEIATVTRIAKNLGVTKATVTAALNRLKLVQLLEHERYGDVLLTEEGRQKALTVYRRHEFLTDFFVRILGFSRDRAQKVSCVMEHEIDVNTERRLAAFTDAMTQAERNNEGWLRDLQTKLDSTTELPLPLCMTEENQSGTIARLTAQYELRKRLNSMGFIPGARVERIRKETGARGYIYRTIVDNAERSINIAEASAVWLYMDK